MNRCSSELAEESEAGPRQGLCMAKVAQGAGRERGGRG
jgi:hypothetical protein